ncbi:MAG: hypothetical protein SGILL_001907 [Bacillariaceae sp.]
MSDNKEDPPTVVITGGTGGIGWNSAVGIAKTGAKVVITGRNKERGEEAVKKIIDETGNSNISLVVGDVSSFDGIDALAKNLLEETNGKISVLINNAGYLGDELKKSSDGLEMHFAVNVASPWRLTLALLPALKKAEEGRVIIVTGGDEVPGPAVDVDNLQCEKSFEGLVTYGHSKSIAESMAMALADKLKPEGVLVNVIFPGRASTAMTGSLPLKWP